MSVSVVITCHEKYRNLLPIAIQSVDKQDFDFLNKIIVCDNMSPLDNIKGWDVIYGSWGNPNPARNEGLNRANSKWVMFLDADDFLDDDYFSCLKQDISHKIACLYPNIKYIENDGEYEIFNTPEWDYWKLRDYNFVDTSSIWRRDVLLNIDGWTNPNDNLDDYYLIMKLSKNGWQAKKTNSIINKRRKSDGRCLSAINSGKMKQSLYNIRSLAIVTLFSGKKELIGGWHNFINNSDLPKNTFLYLIDNSSNISFSNIINNLDYNVSGVYISRINYHYQKESNENYFKKEKHQHVANLYNEIIPKINEDFILTVEDDVIPPLDGVKKLFDEISLPTKTGAIGGVYASPINKNETTASLDEEVWQNNIPLNNIPKLPIKVNFIGGGFTLWSNSVIKKILPGIVSFNKFGGLTGWDNNFSIKIKENGYNIYLHGDVICDHIK